MAEPKKHFIFSPNTDAHKCVANSTEGGACLTGHHDAVHEGFKNSESCNFRYQGLEQAKSEARIKKYLHSYNDNIHMLSPKYPEGVPTSAYAAKSTGNMTPAWYCSHLEVPRLGDWDVGGPNRNITRGRFVGEDDTILRQENFTRGKWPYWNNAHHLIPKGTIVKIIRESGASVGPLIEAGLLRAEYNINHKINMLLMPQDKEVGAILDMPRHIQNKDGDAPNIKSACTNHPVYNEMVINLKQGLRPIVNEYKKNVKEAQKAKCEKPDYKLNKSKLEELSKDLLDIILAGDGGQSLDKLASLNED